MVPAVGRAPGKGLVRILLPSSHRFYVFIVRIVMSIHFILIYSSPRLRRSPRSRTPIAKKHPARNLRLDISFFIFLFLSLFLFLFLALSLFLFLLLLLSLSLSLFLSQRLFLLLSLYLYQFPFPLLSLPRFCPRCGCPCIVPRIRSLPPSSPRYLGPLPWPRTWRQRSRATRRCRRRSNPTRRPRPTDEPRRCRRCGSRP